MSVLQFVPGDDQQRGPWKADELAEPTIVRTVKADVVVPAGARRLLTLTEVLRSAGIDLPDGLEARLSAVQMPDGVTHVSFSLESIEE